MHFNIYCVFYSQNCVNKIHKKKLFVMYKYFIVQLMHNYITRRYN